MPFAPGKPRWRQMCCQTHCGPLGHRGISALLSHVQGHSLPFPHSHLMSSRGLNLVHSSVPGLRNVPCPHLRREVSHRGTVICRVIQRGHDCEGQGSCSGSSEGSLGARLCLEDPREIPSSGGGPWCVVKSEDFWSQMDKVVSALSVQGSRSPLLP